MTRATTINSFPFSFPAAATAETTTTTQASTGTTTCNTSLLFAAQRHHHSSLPSSPAAPFATHLRRSYARLRTALQLSSPSPTRPARRPTKATTSLFFLSFLLSGDTSTAPSEFFTSRCHRRRFVVLLVSPPSRDTTCCRPCLDTPASLPSSQAKIITGNRVREKVYIPRIALSVSDGKCPFKFTRRQFPILKVMEITRLSAIQPFQQVVKIQVRLCRIWKTKGQNDENEVKSIDCVMVDVQGTGIHAMMEPGIEPLFMPKLIPGTIYEIQEIVAVRNHKFNIVVSHEAMLEFRRKTKVKEIKYDWPAMPMHFFNFIKYENIVASNDGQLKGN
ncbi:hypothetical protein Tsubulata_019879 [Turnera subulata]|uniref:Replication protein A 70 kDa DNA-binding subunit B/D first OB fold domain-containing protein n=1 Tax=Turnera subulata TaxID=218843 RepID=A0A9Q0EZ75_9ROSI|nr:hypothetical protein Tsubulata_019879 [Turnera subulata]